MFLTCCNEDSIHRLSPLVVGSSARPKFLLRRDAREFEFDYSRMKKRWMTHASFFQWLDRLNQFVHYQPITRHCMDNIVISQYFVGRLFAFYQSETMRTTKISQLLDFGLTVVIPDDFTILVRKTRKKWLRLIYRWPRNRGLRYFLYC